MVDPAMALTAVGEQLGRAVALVEDLQTKITAGVVVCERAHSRLVGLEAKTKPMADYGAIPPLVGNPFALGASRAMGLGAGPGLVAMSVPQSVPISVGGDPDRSGDPGRSIGVDDEEAHQSNPKLGIFRGSSSNAKKGAAMSQHVSQLAGGKFQAFCHYFIGEKDSKCTSL